MRDGNITTAAFAPGEVTMIAMKIGSQWVAYDYRAAQIDPNNGSVMPYKSGEIVMVPLRAVIEGFQGSYAEEGNRAAASFDGATLEVTVGDSAASVTKHGEVLQQEMSVPSEICQGSVFVPLETFKETFGLDVRYYPDEPHAKDVFVISRDDLSIFKNALTVPSVEILMLRVDQRREYVSWEIPKALYDMLNVVPPVVLGELDTAYTAKYCDLYSFPEIAKEKPGVPKGTVTKYHFESPRNYPGIPHNAWVYVPAQYDGTTPAKLLLLTDGDWYLEDSPYVELNLPVLLDNMIHEGKIPVTIALMVDYGAFGPGNPAYRYGAFWANDNRSAEYDSVDERYANFIVDEVMPVALKGLNISENIYDRASVGQSSSAVGAFCLAWHRNDAFGTVLSLNGSYGNIRGAWAIPHAIRRQKKNIRTLLLTSKRDADLVFGNWYLANYAMAAGFEYSGYEYVFGVGKGGHGIWCHRLMPEMLEWAFAGKPFYHEHVELVTGKIDEGT